MNLPKAGQVVREGGEESGGRPCDPPVRPPDPCPTSQAPAEAARGGVDGVGNLLSRITEPRHRTHTLYTQRLCVCCHFICVFTNVSTKNVSDHMTTSA